VRFQKIRNLSRREKRLITIGILAVFLFLSFDHLLDFFYYRPVRVREQILHERNKLERFRLKVQSKPRIESRLASAKKEVGRLERILLPGKKTPVAAAQLQRIIQDIANETKIEVKSQKIEKPLEYKLVLEIPIQVVFRCTIGELTNFLYKIETHPKLLSIPKWTIRVPNHRNPKQIQVTMTISGFLKKG
jgi:hypothetical protein